jgi:uracil-DNA glycosylase family 4
VHARIVSCTSCARLRSYCDRIAREKKAAYRQETYWGRPVPGFGDPRARLLVLGLAPAAHGANRTGRVFTGDGTGGSGDFLMAALHRAGFANIPTSRTIDDGLTLHDAYISAVVRCAPPDNKPLPAELDTCLGHLEAELTCLPRLTVIVALGKIAFDTWWRLRDRHGEQIRPRPRFAHGVRYRFGNGCVMIGSYHPSRQNTNTGKLTSRMFDEVFATARAHLSGTHLAD